jgi:hypothetical protein
VSRDDLLKWGAVNTPLLHKSLIGLQKDISSLPSYKKTKLSYLKKNQDVLFNTLKNAYKHLEIEKFDTVKFQSSIDAVFGLTNFENLRHSFVYFGHVPEILTRVGLPNSSLYMKAGHLFTSMKESDPSKKDKSTSLNYHNISPDIVKQIPDSLKNPLYVLQSHHHPTSLIVVLDLYDKDNNPVIVPIAPFRKQSAHSCQLRYSAVSSIYGKSRFELFLESHKNLILYENKDGSRSLRSRERQSPRVTWEHRISGFHDDYEKSRLFRPSGRQSSGVAWDHFNSGFYEDNIQRYKNTVKVYAAKTGIVDPLFLAEHQTPYGYPQNSKEKPMYDFTGNVSALPQPIIRPSSNIFRR